MARPIGSARNGLLGLWASSLLLSAVGCCHESFRAAVAGTVVDRNRRPVAGAEVVVCTSEGGESLRGCPRRSSVFTGADGRFVIAALPPEPCPPGDVIIFARTSLTVCALDRDGRFVWAPTASINANSSTERQIQVVRTDVKAAQQACTYPLDPDRRAPATTPPQGATPTPVPRVGAETIPPDAELVFSRGGCYGRCPVYSVVIHADGTVDYRGEVFVQTCGSATDKIPVADLRALLTELEDLGFLHLRASYSGEVCSSTLSDVSSYTVGVKSPRFDKQVSRDLGCRGLGPEVMRLDNFAGRVDRVVGSARWTAPCEGDWAFNLRNGMFSVRFAAGSARLGDGRAKRALEEVVHTLQKEPERRLVIIGHAGDREARAALRISEERAGAVAAFLQRRGIDAQRLTVRWVGDAEPVGDDPAADRRVEFRYPPLHCGCL